MPPLEGRIVNAEQGYAVTLPDGWFRADLDEQFMDAFIELMGSEEEMGDFLSVFGDQLQAMIASGVSLVAFRQGDLDSDFATNVNILALPSGGMSLDMLERLNVQQVGNLPGVDGNVDSERVELPAGEALRLTYAVVEQNGAGYRVDQYLFLGGGRQYWLTASGAIDDDDLAGYARAMAESFELID